MRFARDQLSLALSSRRLLAPLALVLFALIGVYADGQNEVQGSFAATAALSLVFCAWLVAALEREIGPTAGAILTVRAGGAVRGWVGRLTIVAIVTLGLTIAFLVYPTALGAFKRPVGAGDLLAAAITHVACGAAGGALALLLAQPARPATAFAAIIAFTIGSIELARPLGALAGPGAVARALSRAPANTISTQLALATLVCVVETIALAYGARRLARWRG